MVLATDCSLTDSDLLKILQDVNGMRGSEHTAEPDASQWHVAFPCDSSQSHSTDSEPEATPQLSSPNPKPLFPPSLFESIHPIAQPPVEHAAYPALPAHTTPLVSSVAAVQHALFLPGAVSVPRDVQASFFDAQFAQQVAPARHQYVSSQQALYAAPPPYAAQHAYPQRRMARVPLTSDVLDVHHARHGVDSSDESETKSTATSHPKVSDHSLSSTASTSCKAAAPVAPAHGSHGERLATVLLIKAVPWAVSLSAARSALEVYASRHGAHITKELVPVWDNHMVFAQLDRPVAVRSGDTVEIEGRRLAVEGAKNKAVDASSPSAVVQVRCLVLSPGRDFLVSRDEEREHRRAAYAEAVSGTRRLSAAAARAIADTVHPRWEDLVVPPQSLRFTRQEIVSSRRRYAQVLVKLPSKKLAGEVKARVDGTRIEAGGLTMVLRLEYARTNALYIRTPCKDPQRLTLTRTKIKDVPCEFIRSVSQFFESSADAVESPPARNSRRRAKQRSIPDDDHTFAHAH
ncbi:hypothetical protein DIPPA_32432 [Diplonema papillatum]|nr:hypothetical protein DIPPA_32432 [Diplonema papillatum]